MKIQKKREKNILKMGMKLYSLIEWGMRVDGGVMKGKGQSWAFNSQACSGGSLEKLLGVFISMLVE